LQAEMPDVTVISQLEMPTVILSSIPAPSMDIVFDARALAAGTGAVAQNAAARQDSTEANPDVPGFTPMTVRPTLTNVEDVQTVLMREYPPVLRDAGIGGAPVLWLFIGTDGRVQRTQVQETSGFEALDQAAANVAEVMRFTPAQNRDQTVAVWVQIPIRFQVQN
ncbi:MAG: energy transducer TonB, partial [Gemmatimonadetes bacterium]|nr:energy transducer TonB [Gemmatimonadota bacterium]